MMVDQHQQRYQHQHHQQYQQYQQPASGMQSPSYGWTSPHHPPHQQPAQLQYPFPPAASASGHHGYPAAHGSPVLLGHPTSPYLSHPQSQPYPFVSPPMSAFVVPAAQQSALGPPALAQPTAGQTQTPMVLSLATLPQMGQRFFSASPPPPPAGMMHLQQQQAAFMQRQAQAHQQQQSQQVAPQPGSASAAGSNPSSPFPQRRRAPPPESPKQPTGGRDTSANGNSTTRGSPRQASTKAYYGKSASYRYPPAMVLDSLAGMVAPGSPPMAGASQPTSGPTSAIHRSSSLVADSQRQSDGATTSPVVAAATASASVATPILQPMAPQSPPPPPPPQTAPSLLASARGRKKTLSMHKVPDPYAGMKSAYLSVAAVAAAAGAASSKHRSMPTSRRASSGTAALDSLSAGVPIHLVSSLHAVGLVSPIFSSTLNTSTATTSTTSGGGGSVVHTPTIGMSVDHSTATSINPSRRASVAPGSGGGSDDPFAFSPTSSHRASASRHLFPWSLAPEHMWPTSATASTPTNGSPKRKASTPAAHAHEETIEEDDAGSCHPSDVDPNGSDPSSPPANKRSSLVLPPSALSFPSGSQAPQPRRRLGFTLRGEDASASSGEGKANLPSSSATTGKRSSMDELKSSLRQSIVLGGGTSTSGEADGANRSGTASPSSSSKKKKKRSTKRDSSVVVSSTKRTGSLVSMAGTNQIAPSPPSLPAVAVAAAGSSKVSSPLTVSALASPLPSLDSSAPSPTFTPLSSSAAHAAMQAFLDGGGDDGPGGPVGRRSSNGSKLASALDSSTTAGGGPTIIYLLKDEVSREVKKVVTIDPKQAAREKAAKDEANRARLEREAERRKRKQEELDEKRKREEELEERKIAKQNARARMQATLAEQALSRKKEAAEAAAAAAAQAELEAAMHEKVPRSSSYLRGARSLAHTSTLSQRSKAEEAEARRKAAREMNPETSNDAEGAGEGEDTIATPEENNTEEAKPKATTARSRATLTAGGLQSLLKRVATATTTANGTSTAAAAAAAAGGLPRPTTSTAADVDRSSRGGSKKPLLTLRVINASKKGDLDELKRAIADEFPPGTALSKSAGETRGEYLNRIDKNGSSALFHASWPGHYDLMAWLLSQGAAVNLQNMRRNTTLHLAVERGHEEVIRLLLRHGANPLLVNSNGSTPHQVLPSAKEQLTWASFLYLNLEAVWRKAHPDWVPPEEEEPNATAAAMDGAVSPGQRTPTEAGATSPPIAAGAASPGGSRTPTSGVVTPATANGAPPDESIDYTPLGPLSSLTPQWLSELSAIFVRKDHTRANTRHLQTKVRTVMMMGGFGGGHHRTRSPHAADAESPMADLVRAPSLPSSARATLAAGVAAGGTKESALKSGGLQSLLKRMHVAAAGGGGKRSSTERTTGSVRASLENKGGATPPLAPNRRASQEKEATAGAVAAGATAATGTTEDASSTEEGGGGVATPSVPPAAVLFKVDSVQAAAAPRVVRNLFSMSLQEMDPATKSPPPTDAKKSIWG